MIKETTTTLIKYARLAYSNSWNLGDHIQTLATEQFLPTKDLIDIERNKLDSYAGDLALLIMQGYFFVDDYQCSFPPSSQILPLFIGFHIEDTAKSRDFYGSSEIISFLKKNGPIGCRDRSTMNFLLGNGVNAYFSRCLTLTFPRRDNSSKRKKVFFIDEPAWLKPDRLFGKNFNELYKSAIFKTQVVDETVSVLPDNIKRNIAIELLDSLRDEAKLVVTSRLHVAGPCIAMGIPVVLIPREATPIRYEAIENLIPIYKYPTRYFKRLGRWGLKARRIVQILYVRFFINWNPTPPDIEPLKESIKKNIRTQIQEKLESIKK